MTASYVKLTCTHDRRWFQQMLVLYREVLWWVVLNKWQIQWQICIWQDIQWLTNSIQFGVVGFQDLNSSKLTHIKCEHLHGNVLSLLPTQTLILKITSVSCTVLIVSAIIWNWNWIPSQSCRTWRNTGTQFNFPQHKQHCYQYVKYVK
jgi:hypothetical protein